VALIRNIVGQTKSTFNIRDLMDEGKILILNVSKGRIGEDSSRLLGALLITRLQLAAMSRVDVDKPDRRDFYLYVDEFQNFATESFASILSEARKYRLNLILAHQYIAQMDEQVRDAVFGNVGTLVSFRVGAEDAEALEKELGPDFVAQDLVNLGKYTIYLKLMIDGLASRTFSAATLPPLPQEEETYRDLIIKQSRAQFSIAKNDVEEGVRTWATTSFGEPEQAPRPRKDNDRRPPRQDRDRRERSYAPRNTSRRPRPVARQTATTLDDTLAELVPVADEPTQQSEPIQKQNQKHPAVTPHSTTPTAPDATVSEAQNEPHPPKRRKPKAIPDVEGLRVILEEALNKQTKKPE
jgi:hypothetical protein